MIRLVFPVAMPRPIVTNAQFHALLEQGERSFSGIELRGLRQLPRRTAFEDPEGLHLSGITFDGTTIRDWNCESGAIQECVFRGALFTRPLIANTRFVRCDFAGAVLNYPFLTNVDFRTSRLASSSFYHGRCDTVSFVDCELGSAKSVLTWWDGLRLTDCNVADMHADGCSFTDCDISPLIDAGALRRKGHRSPSFDWKTICRSLRAIGLLPLLLEHDMPEVMATYMLSSAQALDKYLLFRLMQSTFISYGTPDAEFARRLRDSLHVNGVRTYFFEDDAVPGQRLHTMMWRGVNEHDRVVVICSKASLGRKGVLNEIQQTLDREARDGGASYLIPVAIDDDVFTRNDVIGIMLRDRVVADFRAMRNPAAFKLNIVRLLSALRTE